MAKITNTQKFLLSEAARKDKRDENERHPDDSKTPRVDMMLDEINAKNAGDKD